VDLSTRYHEQESFSNRAQLSALRAMQLRRAQLFKLFLHGNGANLIRIDAANKSKYSCATPCTLLQYQPK